LGRKGKDNLTRKEKVKMFKAKSKLNEIVEEQEETENNQSVVMVQTPELRLRKIGLIGDVDEEKSADIIHGMYALKELGKMEIPPATKRGKTKIIYEPMDFIISTHGGSASDMFALYDVMRDIRQECEIHTFGLGKVMSAGVLLLAAGTKGKRKIGKHCRVMMHSVIGGNSGSIFNLENEMTEVRSTQERYINALKAETKMTVKQINNFFNRHVDIYLSADDAVKLGIADIVV
jgi:ATP-dependent Clp endopeptidase proteolytic subunit ClpP